MKVTVNVTARDIQLGNKASAEMCPVARAVRRLKVLKDRYPSVGTRVLCYMGSYFTQSVFLPDNVVEFIKNFDFGQKVEPFQFTVELTGINDES